MNFIREMMREKDEIIGEQAPKVQADKEKGAKVKKAVASLEDLFRFLDGKMDYRAEAKTVKSMINRLGKL